MKEAVRSKALELGFDDCRFTSADAPAHAAEFRAWLGQSRHGEMGYLERNAHKRVDPQQVLRGAKTVIVLAASYEKPAETEARAAAATTSSQAGIVARYARYADYHDVIAERLKTLTTFVDNSENPQSSIVNRKSLWYVDTGPILERDFAQRAGLGFIGKHTNLISRRLGNWLFLAEIITTIEFEPDPPEQNRCGTCDRCIAACPTAAITAPFQLDARRCISYLTIELKGSIPVEFRPAIGNRIYGCDDCLAACPWNRFAREGRLMRDHARQDLAAPGLLELLALDDPAFQRRFAGTPIIRTKRRSLLRNVCVALGNIGDASALPALQKLSTDPDPLIAEHAQWATREIERRITSGPDPSGR